MVINDDQKEIPIVFFHFTAWKITQATHTDYNGQLLQDLLSKWKFAMGTNDKGDTFNIKVVLTDNNMYKHNALAKVYPNLHVIPQEEEHLQMQWMLAGFLFKLLKEIYKFEDAMNMYNIYLIQFQELRKKPDTISKKKSQGALVFMSYLHGYLKLHDFWQAWSPAGFHEAARLLSISEDFLPHTTNHLKSFNHHIKSKNYKPNGARVSAAEDLDAYDKLEWMEDICDSGANEGTNMKGEEFDTHFGDSHLVISPCRLKAYIQLLTPKPVSPVELPHIQLVDRFDEMSWEECVLDDNGILTDLRASKPPKLDVDYSDLFGSSLLSTPPSTALSLTSSPPSPVTLSKPTTTLVNTGSDLGSINSIHAITMQNILCAEDNLVKVLHYAFSICNDKHHSVLDCHISPSIHE
ncbi:hypothetical protein V8B97DRAFT_1917595 [Scleroderma yunnanense]